MYQRMPLLGYEVMEIHRIDEYFEYFEENVIRKGSDCDPLVKLAYNRPFLAITLPRDRQSTTH